jgi:predicted HicB family RNase H-like nuclease
MDYVAEVRALRETIERVDSATRAYDADIANLQHRFEQAVDEVVAKQAALRAQRQAFVNEIDRLRVEYSQKIDARAVELSLNDAQREGLKSMLLSQIA